MSSEEPLKVSDMSIERLRKNVRDWVLMGEVTPRASVLILELIDDIAEWRNCWADETGEESVPDMTPERRAEHDAVQKAWRENLAAWRAALGVQSARNLVHNSKQPPRGEDQ